MLDVQQETGDKMDKKSTSGRQMAGPYGSDNKKADNGNGGRFPKYSKRKEPNSTRAKPEFSQGRRPPPQRSKQVYDKRPRTRGYFNDNQGYEVAKEERAELGSALQVGSKKGNLNHLLNFTFAPRESSWNSGGHASGWKGRNKWSARCAVKYNKEQFLQANCQFVVKTGEDYNVHFAEPDILVEWNLIEQVHIFSYEVPSCPICLYPPTAAKITRCGHIYCWSCILHYLSLGEKAWRKCPICYEDIHQKHLKSVVALETHNYGVGEQVTMKLMKREKGSTYALPRSQWMSRDGQPHNIKDEVDVRYVKLLMADLEQVQNIVQEEKAALEQQLKEDGQSLEGSFIQAALNLVQERESNLRMKLAVQADVAEDIQKLTLLEKDLHVAPEMIGVTVPVMTWKDNGIKEAIEYSSAFSDEEVESGKEMEPTSETEKVVAEGNVAVENVEQNVCDEVLDETTAQAVAGELDIPSASDEPNKTMDAASSVKAQKTYYFYQVEGGQHIYIHSVNARCLIKEYGCWENCPDTITAKIVELEGISMHQELRKRLPYLNHLPLTCEFKVAELALKPPLLSRETLGYFAEEIEKRRRTRQRKSLDEKKKMKKMREREERMMGIYPDLKTNLSSKRHFPSAHNDANQKKDGGNIEEGDSHSGSSAASTPLVTPFGSPPGLPLHGAAYEPGSPTTPEFIEGDQHNSSTPSFAQMLRQGKAKPADVWPKVSKDGYSAAVATSQGKKKKVPTATLR